MNKPCWDMPPPDELLVSAMTDELTFEHVRDRLERMLAASGDLTFTGVSGALGQDQIGFDGPGRCHIRLKPHRDSLTLDASCAAFTTSLKMPPERSGQHVTDTTVPALVIRCALRAMDAHRVNSEFSIGSGADGDQLMKGMTERNRDAATSTLRHCCALIATGNPLRSPTSVVRIHLPSPFRQARIVDGKGAPLFRKNVERSLTEGLPSVLAMTSHTHGYVTFDHAEVAMAQREADLDAMSILRIVSEGGIDPERALLSAAMAA